MISCGNCPIEMEGYAGELYSQTVNVSRKIGARTSYAQPYGAIIEVLTGRMTRCSEVALDSLVRTVIQDAEGRGSSVTPQGLPTAWVIIQTGPLRFSLPFDHHLQKWARTRKKMYAILTKLPEAFILPWGNYHPREQAERGTTDHALHKPCAMPFRAEEVPLLRRERSPRKDRLRNGTFPSRTL